MGDLYAAMDAFCMVSHSEGYGLAIMEAMMCGKPVIVSDIGLPDVIVDRVNGIVVAGDAASIRDAAAMLDARPDSAAALGREAFRSAEDKGFASTMAERYATLLENLCIARRRLTAPPSLPPNGPRNNSLEVEPHADRQLHRGSPHCPPARDAATSPYT